MPKDYERDPWSNKTGPSQSQKGAERKGKLKSAHKAAMGLAATTMAPEARVIQGAGSLASKLGKYGESGLKTAKDLYRFGKQYARRARTGTAAAERAAKAAKEGAAFSKRRASKIAAREGKEAATESRLARMRTGRGTGNAEKSVSKARSKSSAASAPSKTPADRTFGSSKFKESPKSYAAKKKVAAKSQAKGARSRSVEDIDMTPSKSYPKSRPPSKARASRMKELNESSSAAESKRHLDKLVKKGELTRGQKGMSKKAMKEIGHPVKKSKKK